MCSNGQNDNLEEQKCTLDRKKTSKEITDKSKTSREDSDLKLAIPNDTPEAPVVTAGTPSPMTRETQIIMETELKTSDQTDDVDADQKEKKERRKKKPPKTVLGQVVEESNGDEDKKPKKRSSTRQEESGDKNDEAAALATIGGEERKRKKKAEPLVKNKSGLIDASLPRRKKKESTTNAAIRKEQSCRRADRNNIDISKRKKLDASARKRRRQAAERLTEGGSRHDGKQTAAPSVVPADLAKKKKEPVKPEGFFKALITKARTRIRGKLNKSDDTFIANPEATMKTVDVNAEYGGPEDTGPMPDKCYDNANNNGVLFPKGRPFWCNKDEKPPPSNNYVMTAAMKDLTEGKWILLPSLKEPTDIDPYAQLDDLHGRDGEFFKKDKRILSNTVRSLVTMHDYKQRFHRGFINDDSFKEMNLIPTPKYPISFVEAKQLIQYNRKNRHAPTRRIVYVPGKAVKKRKTKKTTSNTNLSKHSD